MNILPRLPACAVSASAEPSVHKCGKCLRNPLAGHVRRRSRHAVCALASGDGHHLGRYGDAATVRGRARRGPERPAAPRRARSAVGAAAGIRRRITVIRDCRPRNDVDCGICGHGSDETHEPARHRLTANVLGAASAIALSISRQSCNMCWDCAFVTSSIFAWRRPRVS